MWFLCIRPYLREPDARHVTLDEHLVWMEQQHAAGRIVISGPSADRRMGMYLIRADSLEDAEEIASSDPYTVAGDAEFELTQWKIHQILGIGPFTAAGIDALG